MNQINHEENHNIKNFDLSWKTNKKQMIVKKYKGTTVNGFNEGKLIYLFNLL